MKKILPTISVVMPAYNHARYIGESIESVLTQSYRDFELVIVNDGSIDNTEEIVKKFNDSRIRYHFQNNSDAFNAINTGISLSTGKYLAIINSDDVYHPERLEKMIAFMCENDALFAFSDIDLIDSWSRNVRHHEHPLVKMLAKLKTALIETGSLKQTLLTGNMAITTSNFFFARELIETNGVFSPYRYAHDYDFILRAMSSDEKRIVYFPEVMLSYRVHDNNTISENPAKVDIETFRVLLNYLPSLINCNDDKLVVEAFKRQVDEMSYVMNDADVMMSKVFNTLSWKITAPLRYLAEILGKRPPQ